MAFFPVNQKDTSKRIGDSIYIRPIDKFANAKKYFEPFETSGQKNYKDNQSEPTNYLEEAKKRITMRGIQAKLEVLLLTYTFNEDDGKLSFFERRAIRKHFSLYDKKISPEAIADISHFDTPTLGDITTFIENNKISKVDINKALFVLRKICKSTEKYNYIIKQVETILLNTDFESY